MRCEADGQGCLPIGGANTQQYTATSADVGHALVLCVTAANSGGSATRCSAPTQAVVASRPTPEKAPAEAPAAAGAAPAGGANGANGAGGAGGTAGAGAERVTLSAFVNNKSLVQKVRYGKRVPISGRLLGPNGTPMVDAVIVVQSQAALKGAAVSDVTRVVTGPDGRFTYVAPPGPSRVVRFAYRSQSETGSFADTTDVKLLVSAGLTLKVAPKKVRNRQATTFTGRVLGRPLPARGVVVDLQVFYRSKWRTIAAPRTNRKGVYRFKYRFVAGAATWKFRSRVRTDSLYPYELGTSPVKKVKVVG
jgi:hypothetical protein